MAGQARHRARSRSTAARSAQGERAHRRRGSGRRRSFFFSAAELTPAAAAALLLLSVARAGEAGAIEKKQRGAEKGCGRRRGPCYWARSRRRRLPAVRRRERTQRNGLGFQGASRPGGFVSRENEGRPSDLIQRPRLHRNEAGPLSAQAGWGFPGPGPGCGLGAGGACARNGHGPFSPNWAASIQSEKKKKKKTAALLGRFKRAGPGCGFASALRPRMGWAEIAEAKWPAQHK